MSKTGFFLVGSLIVAAVAYQVIGRIPPEALNVALGVMCGIGASIPVSLGLLIALTRQRNQEEQPVEWGAPELEPVRYAPQPVQRIPQVPQYQQMSQPQMAYQQLSQSQPMPQQQMQHQQMQHQQMPQPQIIVVAPQGQGQFPQGFQMPAQWNPQQYPFMQEHANAVDAREWRIIGEE